MNRNAIACCPVLHTLDRQQREKNDAPETDFDRCFPHEPIQEQTKTPAGEALSRTRQALMESARPAAVYDPTTAPPFGCNT